MPNPSQEPPASSKAPNEDFKDMDVLCTLKIKIESHKFDHGYIKDQWPYPNQYQDAKPQSGTSSILQSPKWGLKGHGCSLHLQNQDREPKFKIWAYQRPVSISKSISGCQCTFKIEHKFGTWVSQVQWLYTNRNQDAKPISGTSSLPKPQIRT